MDKRQYPRANIRTQQRILCISTQKKLHKNIVVSRNISASGVSFRSATPYETDEILLIHLDDEILEDIKLNRAQVMKFGKYFLARVLWSRHSTHQSDPFFDIGCSFIRQQDGDQENIELFTKLINYDTADRLAQ